MHSYGMRATGNKTETFEIHRQKLYYIDNKAKSKKITNVYNAPRNEMTMQSENRRVFFSCLATVDINITEKMPAFSIVFRFFPNRFRHSQQIKQKTTEYVEPNQKQSRVERKKKKYKHEPFKWNYDYYTQSNAISFHFPLPFEKKKAKRNAVRIRSVLMRV